MIFTYISMSVSQLYYLFYVDMDMMGLCWAPDDDSFLAFNLRTKVENHKSRHSLIYNSREFKFGRFLEAAGYRLFKMMSL